MKKILSFVLTLCGASGLTAVALPAADPAPAVSAASTAGKSGGRLDLTAEQKTRLDSLREQMKAVLTPEQQQKMANARERFHQGGRAKSGRGRHDFERHGHGPKRVSHHRGDSRQLRHSAMRAHAKMKYQRERRAEMLGLTDDQRAKMRQVAFQHREKAIGLRKELRAEMESILTPEQKAKAREMKDRPGRRGSDRLHKGGKKNPSPGD